MVHNKLSIKADHLKSDPHPHLRPSSPQTHKKMKKSRSINSDHPSPFRKTKPPPPSTATPQKQSPNYMKSTSSFQARKERLVPLTPGVSHKTPFARTSGLKPVTTLLKSPSFKPSRPSKKCSPVVLCGDLDTQKKTCSSTLKDAKFPDCLQLNPGEGTSVMKVCPYSYCSLNGHRHTPSPPLRCFLSARRRALKTHKSLKLGCLSPRQTNKESKEGPVIVAEEAPMEDETRDFFVEIYSKDGVSEASDIGREEEEYDSSACVDDGGTNKSDGIAGGGGDAGEEKSLKSGVESLYKRLEGLYDEESGGDAGEEKSLKCGVESLYKRLEGLYDEESVSSEDRVSESDCGYQKDQSHDQVSQNSDGFEVWVSPTADRNNEMDKMTGIDKETNATSGCMGARNHDIKYSIGHQQEETHQGNDSESAGHGTDMNHTIIYNIIQVNISVFVTGERKEHSETDQKDDVVRADHKLEHSGESGFHVNKMKSPIPSKETTREEEFPDPTKNLCKKLDGDSGFQVNKMKSPIPRKETTRDEEFPDPTKNLGKKLDGDSGFQVKKTKSPIPSKETTCDEEFPDPTKNLGKKLEGDSGFQVNKTKSPIPRKETTCDDEFPDPTKNLGKKLDEEMKDSSEFNPRGPNFLPPVPEPDAETVDLRHQTMDERKNAEEWMVDFALQQAVTRLAPARKRKVALLVEAFEKVTPIPHLRHASKAFTNVRPMQACS